MLCDYEYLAKSLASLSGLPVRYYTGSKLAGLFHHTEFEPDLAVLEEQTIFSAPGNVSYYMDGNLLCYGLVRSPADGTDLVFGPVTPMEVDRKSASAILREIGEPLSRTDELMTYLLTIPSYPLRNFLQILCTVNYFINREKTDVEDLIIGDVVPDPIDVQKSDDGRGQTVIHNTMELEQEMLSLVEFGLTDSMRLLFQGPVTGRPGRIAPNAIRQQKNLIVCTATLVTRAAVRGGLDPETAFGLSDIYIQKSELLNDYVSLTRLNAQMVMDFTERVERIRGGKNFSRLEIDARNYILEHISEAVTTDDIARFLGKNRTYLCRQFREICGTTVNAYVTDVKMDEAKRLLKYANKTVADIAFCLGFSSQSHFQNTFRKRCGMTPKQYRIRYS